MKLSHATHDGETFLVGPNGQEIGLFFVMPESPVSMLLEIENACNSHAALVAALESAIPCLELAVSKAEQDLEIIERNDLGPSHWDRAHERYVNAGKRLTAARVALSAAK